jgi:prepilin-type N-terminal cleavage/methylation domain-containing protein
MRDQKGFTLIELLVVMAIIGILASTVVMGSIKGAARSRDARRIQELYQITHALQQYYTVYGQYPDNTDTDPDLGCWSNWDGGNEANNPDDFIKPLVDEGFLSKIPKEWTDLKDAWGTQCIYRYGRFQDPCGCSGTYAVLYATCETNKCPTNERPACCDSSWGEGYGENDPYDIVIFLKEK